MIQTIEDSHKKDDAHQHSVEEGIAACFMRRYKMVPVRVPGTRPNFHFFESKTGLDKGKYRGAALVMRIYGNMGDLNLKEIGEIHWGDPKGMILVGFNDVCAFKAADRADFIIISERKGCYE
jgi:hypothetical protein